MYTFLRRALELSSAERSSSQSSKAAKHDHGLAIGPRTQVRIGERKPAALTAAISKVVRDQDDIFVEPASHVTTASATSAQHTPGPPPAVSAGQVAATSSTATTETASSTGAWLMARALHRCVAHGPSIAVMRSALDSSPLWYDVPLHM